MTVPRQPKPLGAPMSVQEMLDPKTPLSQSAMDTLGYLGAKDKYTDDVRTVLLTVIGWDKDTPLAEVQEWAAGRLAVIERED